MGRDGDERRRWRGGTSLQAAAAGWGDRRREVARGRRALYDGPSGGGGGTSGGGGSCCGRSGRRDGGGSSGQGGCGVITKRWHPNGERTESNEAGVRLTAERGAFVRASCSYKETRTPAPWVWAVQAMPLPPSDGPQKRKLFRPANSSAPQRRWPLQSLPVGTPRRSIDEPPWPGAKFICGVPQCIDRCPKVK